MTETSSNLLFPVSEEMNSLIKLSKFRRFGCLMSWSRISLYRNKYFINGNLKCCNSTDSSLFTNIPNRLPDLLKPPVIYQIRNFSSDNTEDGRIAREYDDAANETLISLTDMFEDIAETLDVDPDYDVSFENGVLTVTIDKSWGTYVINKQSPNRQIWLSSPISGPKRYDLKDNKWIYSHDGKTLHELLTTEISEALQRELDFTECTYGS